MAVLVLSKDDPTFFDIKAENTAVATYLKKNIKDVIAAAPKDADAPP